jgi:hypothetical protein
MSYRVLVYFNLEYSKTYYFDTLEEAELCKKNLGYDHIWCLIEEDE